jgi:hypothetical protein
MAKVIHSFDKRDQWYNYNIRVNSEQGVDVKREDFVLQFETKIPAGSMGLTLKSNKDFTIEPVIL